MKSLFSPPQPGVAFPAGSTVTLLPPVRPTEFKDVLFKYGKAEHIAGLTVAGKFRVGTTFDYRRNHGKGILDPNENTRQVFAAIEHLDGVGPTVLDQGNIKGLVRDRIRVEEGGRISLHGQNGSVKIVMVDDGPDAFVYCLSKDLSLSAREQFPADYDACAVIHDVAGFFEAITRELQHHCRCRFMGVAQPSYTGHVKEWDGVSHGLPGYFLKDEEFQSQNEVRAVWETLDGGTIWPVNLQSPQIPGFATRLY